MSRRAAGLLGAAALLSGLTVLARVVGFGRVLVFSNTVGSTCVGTAYNSANTVPNILFEVVAGGALAGAVVPLLAGAAAEGRRAEVSQVASALLTWALVVLAPLALLLGVLAGPIGRALLDTNEARGCPGAGAQAGRMLLLFAPQVVLYGVGVVLTGVLQAQHRFAGPALAPLASSVVVIAVYVAYGRVHPQAAAAIGPGTEVLLAGGTTLGVLALSLPLLVPVRRSGVRLRPTLRFPPGVGRRARSLATAGLGALLAQQVSVLVSLVLANRLGGTGVWNVTQYVQAVYLLPYAVLAVPLATAAFPRMSAQSAAGDLAGFAASAAQATRLVVLASALGAGVLVAVAPAVQALFVVLDSHGAGPLREIAVTASVFAPGLVGFGLIAVVSRALYAGGRGSSAGFATAAGWLAVALASMMAVLLLAGPVGQHTSAPRATVVGLAMGNSIGMTLGAALLLRALRSAVGPAALRGTGRALLVGLLAGLGGGLAGRLLAGRLVGPAVPGAGAGAVVTAVWQGALLALVAGTAYAGVVALADRRDAVALVGRLRRGRGRQDGTEA